MIWLQKERSFWYEATEALWREGSNRVPTGEGCKAEDHRDLIARPCSVASFTLQCLWLGGMKQMQTVAVPNCSNRESSWEHVSYLARKFQLVVWAGCRGGQWEAEKRRWLPAEQRCRSLPGNRQPLPLAGQALYPLCVWIELQWLSTATHWKNKVMNDTALVTSQSKHFYNFEIVVAGGPLPPNSWW